MNLNLLIAFVVASLALLATPGPDLLAVIGRGVGQGRYAAIVTVIGYALGDAIQTTFAILGLSALIRSSAIAFEIVKYIGAIYLVFLGIQEIRHKQSRMVKKSKEIISPAVVLRQSIVASILNPKTALFFLAFLPQFVDVTKGNIKVQLFILGIVFMVLGIVAYAPIAYFAGSIGHWLQTKQKIVENLRWVTGSIFILLGLRVAFLKQSH